MSDHNPFPAQYAGAGAGGAVAGAPVAVDTCLCPDCATPDLPTRARAMAASPWSYAAGDLSALIDEQEAEIERLKEVLWSVRWEMSFYPDETGEFVCANITHATAHNVLDALSTKKGGE